MTGTGKSQWRLARRADKVNPFRVMDILRRAGELEAAGVDVVHMEVGEPDFTTAEPILQAARAALAAGHTRYTAAAGIAPLREALSGFYRQRYGASVAPERIFITPGASGGLNLLANLLIEPGDGILLADPAYPCNRNFISLAGGDPQLVPVSGATRFQPTPALLDRFHRPVTRGLWLASPGNPTGTLIHRDELRQLLSWARQHDCHVVMDEIYQGLHYTEDMPSILQESDHGFVVNSFSKYFGMTGWRLGWVVVPAAVAPKVEILCQNLFISASSIAQHAALAAFAPATLAILEQRRAEFRRRRDFLAAAIQEIGFILPAATEGAFYLYADISNFAEDSETFCRHLLEQHGVALTPGTDFGAHLADRHVRIAFTTSMARLELGVERLRRALVRRR